MKRKPNRRRRRKKQLSDEKPALKLKTVEQLLLDVAEEVSGDVVLVNSTGIGHAAAAVARRLPESSVHLNVLDVFLQSGAEKNWREELLNLQCHCLPDLPDVDADAVMLALPASGESELARDVLQASLRRLKPSGRLFVASDNPKDHWVHDQLKAMFGKVTNRPAEKGRIYIASKPLPLKKEKSFDAWFAFRTGERLLHVMTRPGVFSHRRLDLGARALIESLVIEDGPNPGPVIKPNDRVLDIGCGCGAVGFAAAFLPVDTRETWPLDDSDINAAETGIVHVHFLDANARAIQCTEAGAIKNQLPSFSVQLNADGECESPGTFDLALANPPYFSNYRIGDIMIHAAKRGLKPGGRVHFVTKQPEWYAERFVEEFDEVSVREIRGYFIVKGTQRSEG